MIKYGCGHKTSGLLILEATPTMQIAYEEWANSVGVNGTKTLCFHCWYIQKEGEDKDE